MKRQFEYKEGKTHLCWEIECNGLLLSQRSWGRNRKEYSSTRRFRSEDSAKRECEKEIQSQLDRKFVEIGPNAKTTTKPRLVTDGPLARAAAKKAIVSTTTPALRALGFQGTFPNFRRIENDRHSMVWFQWGRAGGHVVVGLAVVPPKSGTTVAEDMKRAMGLRNRERTGLDDLIPHRDWKLFFFDEAAKKWGAEWPQQVAALLKKNLETAGMSWLRNSARRPGRGSRSTP